MKVILENKSDPPKPFLNRMPGYSNIFWLLFLIYYSFPENYTCSFMVVSETVKDKKYNGSTLKPAIELFPEPQCKQEERRRKGRLVG